MNQSKIIKIALVCAISFALLIMSNAVFAFKQREKKNSLEAKEFRADELYISQTIVPADQVMSHMPNSIMWNNSANRGKSGFAYIDLRSGRPASLTQVVSLIPGTGENNHITLETLSGTLGYKIEKITENIVKDVAINFLKKYANVLSINPKEIGEIKIANTNGDYIWDISIRRQVNGIIIRSSNIAMVLNHGNLVLWGTEKWGDVSINLAPSIAKEQALRTAFDYIGGRVSQDTILKDPHLEIIPIEPKWNGAIGKGYDHILAWVFAFAREGYRNTWEMIVDAHSGKLVAMQDMNLYANKKIVGMIYPLSSDACAPQGSAAQAPMIFTDPGTNFGGFYNYTGGTATTTLTGQYVHVFDNCGTINESSTTGDIDLGGTSGDHDCAIPAGHSAGDTMSSRTAAAEIAQMNRMVASYVNYTWLNSAITCNVNINMTCGAWYSGSLNMQRSGGGCGNAGEIASVLDHEWTHGVDANDPAGYSNPGEVIADAFMSQRLHTSCVGEGFWLTLDRNCGQWTCPSSGQLIGYNCNGYGDCCTACTGIRESDYAKHSSGNPHTPANYICPHCGGGDAPCGKEIHCETTPAAEAQWDLAARDFQQSPYNYDKQTAYEISSRIIILGSGGVTNWYACNCSNNTSNGCAATNGYMQFIAKDDDDGNINNGTPHMTAIYSAFNRHGIACSSPTPTQSGCSGGPTTATMLAAIPGDYNIALSWTVVPGAAMYNVFRAEGPLATNCDFGKAKIATVSGTTYTDVQALNGRTYYYQIQPVGSNAACVGPLSNCVSALPMSSSDSPGKVSNTFLLSKSGSNLSLNWVAPPGSCNVTGFGIYRGTLPWTGYNHARIVCDNVSTNYTTEQDTSSYYYLIVPSNANYEGSYGTDSSGTERPQGSDPCHPQALTACY